jgi:hypothetical protein
MEKEQLINESSGDVTDNSANYIETIKTLKENTVSKEQFLKLKEENKQLLNAFVEGQNPNGDIKSEVVEKVPVETLTQHLSQQDITNLDYVSTALEIRQRLLDEKGIDTFLPNGRQYIASDYDKAAAEKVARELQAMVDIADGDADIFNNEFQRRVQDINLPRRK